MIENLWDTPKALLALLFSDLAKKNVVIITGQERDTRLLQDLNYFAKDRTFSFPSWETLPGEEIAPSLDIVGKRLEILHTLNQSKGPQILLAPLQALLQKVCAPSTLKENFLHWEKGTTLPFEELPTLLSKLGYQREAVAADKGQFAVRHGILDIFPVSAFDPYRIEFFGDEIDAIRTYDPISQKSIEKAESLFIAPSDEQILLEKSAGSLLDYMQGETVLFYDDLVEIEDHYVTLKSVSETSSSLFTPFETFRKETAKLQAVYFSKNSLEDLSDVETEEKVGRHFYSGKAPLQPVTFEICNEQIQTQRLNHPFTSIPHFFWEDVLPSNRLEAILQKGTELELEFVTSSEAEEKALKEKLDALLLPLPKKASFKRGYLSSGFVLPGHQYALIAYPELTSRYRVARPKWRNTHHTPASDFHQLDVGDLVVHTLNGVGKYLGMETQKNHLGNEEEFLILEYANHSKLYVPLSQSHLVSRYIGAREEKPPLHTLGTKKWLTAKAHAEKTIIGYAKDLLKLQAERETKGGFTFNEDSDDMQLFEEEFPFSETDDQLAAIAAIKQDMSSTKAMDRLVCGDVGYGKTEVAMRAAFKAVVDGQKQVAVLVPTTVLAMQHYESFKERMESFPIRIGVASRFVKPKELKETLKGLSEGSVDIMIGTHRLVSQDVQFKDLGLIIIDEEQRFGVRAKEHLKKAKIGVDCLTLSATPIPRTLYFSLVGAKDMSVINTPPHDRLPIKTILAEKDKELIKNALVRELSRDGQAYFIHNRVESIFDVAKELEELVPAAKIAVVHGQMPAHSIDSIFHDFKQGETDILIATTIVENGIDIPNANTILIDRANAYGMADLYQLRGRVGRWNRPAYAYLLVPQNRELDEISQKRLQALVATSGFGGGMKLAMRDLEIRGAGNLLGVQQSGNVATIGFHYYCKLLKRTIESIKKRVPITFQDTKLEHRFNANLPPFYIGETHLRMEIYHRLGETSKTEEVDALFDELIDRFGPLPTEAKWLYHLNRIRIHAAEQRFTLLKFERIALFTQKKNGKQVTERRIPFPQCDDPKNLEQITIEMLKRV